MTTCFEDVMPLSDVEANPGETVKQVIAEHCPVVLICYGRSRPEIRPI
jgi:hypothetical protein